MNEIHELRDYAEKVFLAAEEAAIKAERGDSHEATLILEGVKTASEIIPMKLRDSIRFIAA